MPDPLTVIAFTVVPLGVLVVGIGLSLWGARRIDRWLVLAAVLFAMMGVHQAAELRLALAGGSPYDPFLGEVVETGVNLLAVVVIVALTRRVDVERRRGERQAVVGETVAPGPVPGHEESGTGGIPASPFDPAAFELPVVGRLLAVASATLPLGTTAKLDEVLETAVQNLAVTYPTATVRLEAPAVTVFAEPTTLREIVEVVVKQLIVYTEAREPVVEVTATVDGPTVEIEIADNGQGLPPDVAAQLVGEGADGGSLELAPVDALLENWGGSVSVENGTVTVGLVAPKPGADQSGRA
jgi:hypothetical protein